MNWTDQLSNFRTQYFKYLFKINKQQPHIWGKTWLQAVPCVTIQHSTAQQHDQPGKGRVTHCSGKHVRWWLLYLLAYLDLFPHVISGWLSWLVDIGRQKGFGLTEAPNFMILMVFWPQSSLIIHQKPGQRLSGIDYVFTTTRGTRTIIKKSNKKNSSSQSGTVLCAFE